MEVGGLPVLPGGFGAGEIAQVLDDLAYPVGAFLGFAEQLMDVVAQVVEVGVLPGGLRYGSRSSAGRAASLVS
jgi:hypothetical protein